MCTLFTRVNALFFLAVSLILAPLSSFIVLKRTRGIRFRGWWIIDGGYIVMATNVALPQIYSTVYRGFEYPWNFKERSFTNVVSLVNRIFVLKMEQRWIKNSLVEIYICSQSACLEQWDAELYACSERIRIQTKFVLILAPACAKETCRNVYRD